MPERADATTTPRLEPDGEPIELLDVGPRFDLVRRLGAGGMGVVYEAIDREHGARVALKTLRTLSADGVLRLKSEFRALADISHANLVRFGELFERDGQWFFTMELVDGGDFLAYVRPGVSRGSHEGSRGGALDEPRLRDALAQLARGLIAVHGAGKVHRDVKPSNVLVARAPAGAGTGRVVVLDFGIAVDAARRGPRESPGTEEFVGTFAYMAPEQARAEAAAAEADWYSVGVMLYEALAGRLPHVGAMESVLTAKQLVRPAPPSTYDPSAPRDLERLCMDLLEIEPPDRPTGREVLERLRTTSSWLPPVSAPPRDRFVGRARELASLRDAYDRARRGDAVTVLAIGESGVGKSALVRRFAEEIALGADASSPAPLVFAGRCYERESVPYKAFDGIVDAVAHYLQSLGEGLGPGARDEAETLVPRDRALLGRVFPVLRGVNAIATARGDEGSAIDPLVLRARVFAALRALFTSLAARAPVVVLVDDLQWADADSIALLQALLQPPRAPAVLLVATARASDPKWALPGDVREIAVGTLPREDAEELAAALLQDADPEGSDGGAEPISVGTIALEAAGHPLFIDELVRARAHSRSRGAPLRLDDALSARVDRLDPGAQRVLRLVALAGLPLEQQVVAHAAGEEFATFAERVALLRAAHLVRTSGARRADAVEPFHDRVRETIARRLPDDDRRRLHAALAKALEASGAADPEALARHWRGAGDRARARAYTLRAAARASDALAFDRAANLYEQAIEDGAQAGPPGAAELAALRARLGDALANASRGQDAARAYLTAAEGSEPDVAFDLRRRAAEQLLRAGLIDEAIAAFEAVLGEFGMRIPRSARGALAALLVQRARVRLRGLRFEERREADVPRRDLLRVDACWMVGAGLGLVDTIVGSYFQTRGLALALAAGEPRRIARAIAIEACFSAVNGGKTRARTAMLLRTSAELAQRVGTPYAEAWAMGAPGVAASLEGRWQDAYDACARAERIFRERCTGVGWEMGQMRWFGGLLATAYLGRVAELSRVVPERLEEARARGDLHAQVGHITGQASLVWLAADEPAAARARVHDVMSRWSRAKFHVEHWWATQAEAQIDLYEQRGRAALDLLASRWDALEGSLLLMCQMTRLEAWHLRARAALVAAGEEPAHAKRHLASAEKDARAIAGEAMPWSDPLATLVRAGAAAGRGEGDGARAMLDEAIPRIDAGGMALIAAAARHRRGALDARLLAERDAAAAWMRDQGIVDVEKIVAMLVPWPTPGAR
jgi:tetratricopeptide (TPR) repeat protein